MPQCMGVPAKTVKSERESGIKLAVLQVSRWAGQGEESPDNITQEPMRELPVNPLSQDSEQVQELRPVLLMGS